MTMMTIVEYAVGVLLIGLLSMPQTLLIGLVRGAIHRFVRRLPTIVRLALDVTLGVLVYWFVSGLWSEIFGHVLPLVFIVVSIVASRLFVNKDDLKGAAPMNEVALTAGGIALIALQLWQGVSQWLP